MELGNRISEQELLILKQHRKSVEKKSLESKIRNIKDSLSETIKKYDVVFFDTNMIKSCPYDCNHNFFRTISLKRRPQDWNRKELQIQNNYIQFITELIENNRNILITPPIHSELVVATKHFEKCCAVFISKRKGIYGKKSRAARNLKLLTKIYRNSQKMDDLLKDRLFYALDVKKPRTPNLKVAFQEFIKDSYNAMKVQISKNSDLVFSEDEKNVLEQNNTQNHIKIVSSADLSLLSAALYYGLKKEKRTAIISNDKDLIWLMKCATYALWCSRNAEQNRIVQNIEMNKINIVSNNNADAYFKRVAKSSNLKYFLFRYDRQKVLKIKPISNYLKPDR